MGKIIDFLKNYYKEAKVMAREQTEAKLKKMGYTEEQIEAYKESKKKK